MSTQVIVLSYLSSAVAFAVLGVLLLTSWKGRLQGGLLVAAVFLTSLWSVVTAFQTATGALGAEWIFYLELVRNVAWLLFLLRLLPQQLQGRRTLAHAVLIVALALPIVWQVASVEPDGFQQWLLPSTVHVLFIGLAVYGLVLIEQLYRNTRPDYRWNIKFLCIGLGAIMAYDLYMYSHAMLVNTLDNAIWWSRGAISALAAPLLMVAAARNPKWSLDVFVSRSMVFHSFALIAAGLYLIAMAAVGYAINVRGGAWGSFLQIVFTFGAGLVLLLVIMSGQIRAHIKVFVNKHFFNYKYDYREEWMKLTRTLSASGVEGDLPLRAIKSMAEIVDSNGGVLFISEGDEMRPAACWNVEEAESNLPLNSDLMRFVRRKKWIIDLYEYGKRRELYDDIELPSTITDVQDGWLVVPLVHMEDIIGLMVLTASRAPHTLNWEDFDLLKVAARHVASDIAQDQAAEALSYARQFETYNRVSAFIMHDLKNVTGQLSLVVQNGERLKDNPEFVEDAFSTVANSVVRIKRLLNQLKQSRDLNLSTRVHLNKLLERVVAERSLATPTPMLKCAEDDLQVVGNADKLASVIGNVIQNAQDATSDDGTVNVSMFANATDIVVNIQDSGEGMSRDYIKNGLFKPFNSTKGESGMGIGAYEAKEYLESLGGRITVVSEPGEGTNFALHFPRVHTDTIERVA